VVIEMDPRDHRRRLERLRFFLSIAVTLSVLPLLFDPIAMNFTLLALAFNAVVWVAWLLDVIGRLREMTLVQSGRQPPQEYDSRDLK
jgi:hypothetical protein